MKTNFYILVGGEAASQLGSNLFDIAIMWTLYRLTRNTVVIGGVSAVFNGLVVLEVLTGFLADKYAKTKIMLLIDGLQAGCMLGGALLFSRTALTLVGLVTVTFSTRLLGTFFGPAEMALIPRLVQENQLRRATSLNQGVGMLMEMAGMLLGGVLVTSVSLTGFLVINSVSFVISGLCVAIVSYRLSGQETRSVKARSVGRWSAGLRYLVHQPVLRVVVGLALLVNLTLGPVMGLDVVWVRGILHAPAVMYSFMQMFLIVGVILGNILVNLVAWSLKRRLVGALTMMGLATLVLAISRNLVGTLSMILAIGLAAGFLNVSIYTLIQQQTPSRLLGRVNGAMLASTNLSLPVGTLLGGVLASRIQLANVFILGAMVTLAAMVCLLRVRLPEDDTLETR
ncbi:MAG TPA: MFS transporter [Candidatus Levilactobacillus faecigallinarum]|uniref:MFS transporter n=1 Tax=Candidatus Levilactobacillus faecigallinarum TaxID=2838638 RepID=A0A9D1QQV3_9LACO|nr:MFS transporter [Candidatus Levilactobacillus faecigallinarum]